MPPSEEAGFELVDRSSTGLPLNLPDDLIRRRKLRSCCGCTCPAIDRWIHKGRLRAWKRGRDRYLVSRREVLSQLQPDRDAGAGGADGPGHRRILESFGLGKYVK